MEARLYQDCVSILKSELLPAMGCTEPIAVAYAAALARKTLGCLPTSVHISVSGNILKNVKSVIVPNTGNLRGVTSAAAAGIAVGDAERQLEVLSSVTESDYPKIREYLARTEFTVCEAQAGCIFDIGIEALSKTDRAFVRITGHHTNVIRIEKNGHVLLSKSDYGEAAAADADPLSIAAIYQFATEADLDDVRETLERQIAYNVAISDEGLRGDYGAKVGKTLLKAYGDSVHNRAKAAAAAGSDARMNGCALPVVIVSGSGNQGMTASLPVITYAKYLNADRDQLLRALIISDLVTVHLKHEIGRLSAYCGAVSAGCGAAAGICFLYGGALDEISHTVVNALAIASGIVCDGAKSSCAAKIASAVEAGLLGFELYRNGSQFYGGDGIVEKGVENTIHNVGELASKGMRETDEEIIRLMIKTVS